MPSLKFPTTQTGCILLLAEIFFLQIGLFTLLMGIGVLASSRSATSLIPVAIGGLVTLVTIVCIRETLTPDTPVVLTFAPDPNTFSNLTPRESVSVASIRRKLALPSHEEVRKTLGRAGNSAMAMANPRLQPIAFAFRPTTATHYLKGVVIELFTWLGVLISLPFITLSAAISGWLAYAAGKEVLYRAIRKSRTARRYRSRPHNILRHDARPPILYLRAFSEDYGERLEGFFPGTTEEKLAEHYNQYGPVLTIGNPAEEIPLLGATRIYFDADMWEAGALYLMSISQMIVLQAGFAEGLLWELGAAYSLVPPEKFLLSFAAWIEIEPEQRRLNYLRFKKRVEKLIDLELPDDIENVIYVSFKEGWKYQLLKGKGT
jgi:hypothetical protein